MAPFGTIYSYPNNPRVLRVEVIADMNGLELELGEYEFGVTNKTPDFLAKFPLGKVPAFESADGLCLVESVAIARYVAQSGPRADQLLGEDAKTQALIEQWVVFSEAELSLNVIVPVLMRGLNIWEYEEKRYKTHFDALMRDAKYLDKILEGGKKYLVGDQYTLADIMVCSFMYWASKFIFSAELRKQLPNLAAYIKAFASVEVHKKHFGELLLNGLPNSH
ncbi:glutathione S-transferase [Poronia punctata]|nr:glutathione S-transferase [Poronia punctata]